MSVSFSHIKYPTFLISFLSALILSAFFVVPAVSFAQSLPLITEGEGMHFEAGDGSAPPVTLDSTEVIDVRLVSALETTTLRLNSSSASSTILTIGGLSPERRYFLYEGGYHDKRIFTTDIEGRFSFTQDLANAQFLIIQPRESTFFIRDDTTGGDCVSIGTWNSATKTCVLTGNLAQTIQIDSNGITLDGGGYMLSGPGSGMGVFLAGRKGVTIKNLTVKNFRDNIALVSSEGITIEGNTLIEGGFGVSMDTASSTSITRNTFTTLPFGIFLLYSNANILSQNVITNNHSNGIFLARSNRNTVTQNRIENGLVGITLQLSDNNTIHNNTIRNQGYYAMNLQYSQNNEIFQNNFLVSAIRHINSFNSVSLFNRGLPDGGNYWDTYDKPAEGCTDTNTDGFCDTPLVLDWFNSDLLPCTTQDGWVSTPDTVSALFYAEEEGFVADTISPGVHPNKGTASSTPMVFKVIYTGTDAPDTMNVEIGGQGTITLTTAVDTTTASSTLKDGDYTNGEQFIATSTFPKGKYQYYFEATNGADTIRLPAQTDAPTTLTFQTGYSNVAFLPGLLGSRLYKQQIFENKLWEPNRNLDIKKLYLTDVGESVDPSIYTNDIIDEAFGFNVYKKFSESMDDLVANGTIKEWQAMPYDWRMDLEDILDSDVRLRNDTYNIIQNVELLAESSDNGQVTILGHSNGGLLGKLLISKLADAGKGDMVDKFIMVGTPQLGTPNALMGLLHGGERGVLNGWLPNHEVTREFGENMQSAYNLLPLGGYFSAVDTVAQPIIEFDVSTSATSYLRSVYGDSISLLSNLTQFFTGENGVRSEPAPSDVDEPNVIDSQLLGSANNLHATLDQWTPPQGVDVIQIAGWGLDTLRGIRYEEQVKQVCNAELSVCQDLPFLDPRPLFTQDGDKTVVIPSAVAMRTDKYYLNLKNYNKEFIFGGRRNRDHADILEAVPVQDLVKYLVINEQTLPQHITTTKPPIENPTYRLAVHSPVSIHAYGSFGNHTGIIPNTDPTSDIELIEEQIPNSYYLESGEGKYLGLDTGGEYRIELQGEDFGTFTFELQEVLGDEVLNAVEYKNIPVSASTTAELVIQNLNIAPELVLDIDGDGATDAIFTGVEDNDILASMEILRNIVNGLDIHKELKKELIKKLEKAEKELRKGKTEKVIKQFDEIIKKLKEEIEENLEEESEKEDDESDRQEHEKGKGHDGDERKITTENAWMLIGIIEDIKSLLI